MAVLIDRAIRRGLITAGIVVTSVVAGHSGPAFALEFGALTVRSHLNQPLDATVVLNNLDASERASLDVGVAPPTMFQRFGIRRSSVVDRIQIDTRRGGGGDRAVVHIATKRPVSEPFVDFLLQVDAGNGRALREYTAMLNPAGAAVNAPAQPMRPTAASPAPDHRARASTPAAARSGSGESSHRVRRGDTLWSVAAANTPHGATVAQTMLAIYRANPSAFDGGMSALSQNTRLTIPAAATVRAVNDGTAQKRLQDTSDDSAESVATAPDTGDNGSKLAASGEAPPESLEHATNPAVSERPGAEPSGTMNSKTPSVDDTTTAHTPPDGPFGRMSLPSGTPWPAPQTSATGSPAAASAADGAMNDATASDDPTTATEASSTTPATPTRAASPASTAADDQANATTPPSDVAAADEGAWLSPRNLLLLIVVLALAGLILRRLRERGYKTVTLDREEAPDDGARGADTPSERPDAGATATVDDKPATRESELTPIPATRTATPEPGPSEGPAAPPVAPAGLDTPPESTHDEPSESGPPEADMPVEHSSNDALEAASDAEADQPASRVRPMRFEPADAPEPGDRLFAHRRPATNEEIEALAFEAQPLPNTGEREHDRGDRSEPGLDFDDSAADTGAPGDNAESGDVHRPDPYDLEMIDPGGFDLYDPPSEAAGQTDDDPNDSVEIRLDLARMYIEMDDATAARELLADVRERGDDDQRGEAEQLLERLDS